VKKENKYLNILGCKMSYLTRGQGYPIFLIHGFGADSYSFRNNIPVLSEYFKVYAPDLIGFGNSDKPETNYCLSFFIGQIHQFLQLLKIDKIMLVGASWGGAVAFSYAIEYPRRVDKLVVIDCITAHPTAKGILASQRRLKALIDINRGKKSIKWGKKVLEGLLKEGYYDQKAVTDKIVNEQFKMWKTKAARSAQIAIRSQCDFREIINKISTINKEILIIWGERDPWQPLESAKMLQKSIKKSRLVIIPNAGHAPHETHPDVVNREILEFLKKV